MIYLELFWAFLQVGLFSIGGGYAALPIIQNQVIEINKWITIAEFADIMTIAEMTPGPIAINTATFVGTRIGGLPGAVIATLGCIAAPCIIVITLAILYKKYHELNYVKGVLSGLRPAVVGLIASAGLSILLLAVWNGAAISLNVKSIDFVALALIAACVVILRKTKLNTIFVMLAAGAAGGLIYSLI